MFNGFRSIWMTSDILFGSMSLGLIDEHPPYLVVWLGGQNHISTRPHRDRSDTVGILPAVKCRRMGAWGAEPKYCSKTYYSETKHIAEIPTMQHVLLCLAKDSFCSPVFNSNAPIYEESLQKLHEKRTRGDKRNAGLTAIQTSHRGLHVKIKVLLTAKSIFQK